MKSGNEFPMNSSGSYPNNERQAGEAYKNTPSGEWRVIISVEFSAINR